MRTCFWNGKQNAKRNNRVGPRFDLADFESSVRLAGRSMDTCQGCSAGILRLIFVSHSADTLD